MFLVKNVPNNNRTPYLTTGAKEYKFQMTHTKHNPMWKKTLILFVISSWHKRVAREQLLTTIKIRGIKSFIGSIFIPKNS
jgi:hypothetical protein